MKVLAIDTTSMLGSVALCEDAKALALDIGNTQRHAEALVKTIDELFTKTGWSKSELNGIAVAIGPGSFTGLRIGLAVAKGMAIALSVPIAGVSSLRSLAVNGMNSKKFILPMIDARRGEIYCAIYRENSSGGLYVEMDECAISPQALADKLKATSGSFFATGDGAIAFKELFKKELGERFFTPEDEKIFPSARNVSELALEKLHSGGDDLASLSLNYIRVSDAEIGFLGNLKKG